MGSSLNSLQTLLQYFVQNESEVLNYISYSMLSFGVLSFVMLQIYPSPYGRHGSADWGFLVNAKFAWFIQELPAFLIPVLLICLTDSPRLNSSPNKVLLGMFLLHYFQRTFLYSFLIRGGKPTPSMSFFLAVIFCATNGYLQGRTLTTFSQYSASWMTDLRFIGGSVLFLTGFVINLHSDHILRTLRKPGETGYKIPQGGLFQYVSGANFLGEILEWSGYALAAWNLPALAFASFTFFNLVPRAMQHHRWYKQKFEDYPKERNAVIPFLF